ncbi:MAG TPA: hypothetical protein VNG51_26085 [Ktedonobacteraceae bacterium]|nr:hypothetical protein [Ktedonobacteraceae bacterium]
MYPVIQSLCLYLKGVFHSSPKSFSIIAQERDLGESGAIYRRAVAKSPGDHKGTPLL